MFRDDRPWQERQAEADKIRKQCTCPVCGKRIQEWTCFRTPTHGMIACGQWYCSRKHWAADPNSSFYKNPRYSRMSRLYLRFEQLRKRTMRTKVLHEECPPECRDHLEILKNEFDKYLEHLADVQAGITLKVDRPMVIDEVDQVVAPGRRRVREELVKPGVFRLRAFRRYRDWRSAGPRLFDYEYCFVLDITKQGLNGSEFRSEIWFENALTLHHILKMQFSGVIEIDRDNWLPGTTKITFTRSYDKRFEELRKQKERITQ